MMSINLGERRKASPKQSNLEPLFEQRISSSGGKQHQKCLRAEAKGLFQVEVPIVNVFKRKFAVRQGGTFRLNNPLADDRWG